jgi:hypothetical protein
MLLIISIISSVVIPLLINKTTENRLDWVKPYLRQAWCAVVLMYVIYFLTTDAAKQLVLSWAKVGNVHPVLVYVVPAAMGAIIAPSYWWLMGKLLPRGDARKNQPTFDAFKNPHWEIVTGHNFVNEAIELDGKSFRKCKFTNVTLTYSGKAPSEILAGCLFEQSTRLESRNPALIEYWRLHNFLCSIPGARVQDEGPADAKGNPVSDKVVFQPAPPVNPIHLDLCSRVLILCKEMQAFLIEHGREPKIERQPQESREDYQKRWREVVMPWRTQFHGDYRIRFGMAVPNIRDEIKARHGVHDGFLDTFIDRAECNPNGDREAVDKIITILWSMALRVDDGTMQPL